MSKNKTIDVEITEFVMNPKTGEIYEAPKTKHVNEKMDFGDMQKFVGGLVQVIDIDKGKQLIINEEGKFIDNRLNSEATKLAKGYIMEGDYIAGDVLVLSGKAKLT